ncbi:hypothetical protein CIC12_18300 [Burkholderia sp. SG-MS1]|nr:hypothetical protein [Paraburkholderia sp. SG-MS1]
MDLISIAVSSSGRYLSVHGVRLGTRADFENITSKKLQCDGRAGDLRLLELEKCFRGNFASAILDATGTERRDVFHARAVDGFMFLRRHARDTFVNSNRLKA